MKYLKSIVALLCVLPFFANAQSYPAFSSDNSDSKDVEMLTPGKSWLCKRYDPLIPITRPIYFKISVDGETVINGISAVKLKYEYIDDSRDPFYKIGYEKDGVIYEYNKDIDTFVPLIDFNVKKGDVLDCFDTYNHELKPSSYSKITVLDENIIHLNGGSRRILTLTYGEYPPKETRFYWIEGIGSSCDSFLTIFAQPISTSLKMVQCYENGKCIYDEAWLDAWVQRNTNEIQVVSQDMDQLFPIYDLSGKQVLNPQKGQIYIRNSQKIVW